MRWSIRNFKKVVSSGEQGTFEYQFGGEEKILGFVKNPTTGWILGGTVNKAEFEQKGRTILTPISITLLIVLVLAIVFSFWMARRITKPIKVVMERMKQIVGGDLSHEPLATSLQNETGQLIVATNEMNQKMRELLSDVNDVAELVSSQSEELTQHANEVKAGAEQVATTMEELAAGAERQANHSGHLSSAMSEFATNVEETNTFGGNIEKASGEVLEMTNDGKELMTMSLEQMGKIDHIVQGAVTKVKGLDQRSQEITTLVAVIREIADQTNLLALNAAIEAARAGEHGKGFAVVADEVRKLAEGVAASVGDITNIVINIQSEINEVTESLQGGYQEVEQGTRQITSTNETFNRIYSSVNQMADYVKMISNQLATISARTQEMNGSIQEVAAITEESAAGIEQTSASAQQTTATMEEVAISSEELAQLAEKLNGLLNRFRL